MWKGYPSTDTVSTATRHSSAMEGRYCSEACENGRVSELKKKRNNLLIVWGIAVAIMVVAIVCSL